MTVGGPGPLIENLAPGRAYAGYPEGTAGGGSCLEGCIPTGIP